MSASPETPTDERLIGAVIAGDDEAFTELVRRHKHKVFRIAARFARDDAELDDICQEIFIKVYQNIRKYRGDAPFEHWVVKIAVNACYDQLRRQRRQSRNISLDDVTLSLTSPGSEQVSSGEALRVLKAALSRLRPKDRLVLTMLNLEEKSVRDVSALTGWSEGNVKVRAFRARKELKRILEADDGNRSK